MLNLKKTIIWSVSLLLSASVLLAEGNPQRGRQVFEQCFTCHNAFYPNVKVGPSLQGLFHRTALVNGKSVSEMNIRSVIKKGGNVMPGFQQLPDQDLNDLIAFLKTL